MLRRYLCSAHAEDVALHGLQALQTQLQANVEEQEHDSKLSKVPDLLNILDNAQSMWPNGCPSCLHSMPAIFASSRLLTTYHIWLLQLTDANRGCMGTICGLDKR